MFKKKKWNLESFKHSEIKKSREFTERFFGQPKMIFGILLVFSPKGGITLKRITSVCSTKIDLFFPIYLTFQLCIQWQEAFDNF